MSFFPHAMSPSTMMSKVTMDEKNIDERGGNGAKTLTMKYNRGFLGALTACDAEVCKICAALYDCEEDDVPIEIDVNELKDLSRTDQKKELEAEFAKHPVPSGAPPIESFNCNNITKDLHLACLNKFASIIIDVPRKRHFILHNVDHG